MAIMTIRDRKLHWTSYQRCANKTTNLIIIVSRAIEWWGKQTIRIELHGSVYYSVHYSRPTRRRYISYTALVHTAQFHEWHISTACFRRRHAAVQFALTASNYSQFSGSLARSVTSTVLCDACSLDLLLQVKRSHRFTWRIQQLLFNYQSLESI